MPQTHRPRMAGIALGIFCSQLLAKIITIIVMRTTMSHFELPQAPTPVPNTATLESSRRSETHPPNNDALTWTRQANRNARSRSSYRGCKVHTH